MKWSIIDHPVHPWTIYIKLQTLTERKIITIKHADHKIKRSTILFDNCKSVL